MANLFLTPGKVITGEGALTMAGDILMAASMLPLP